MRMLHRVRWLIGASLAAGVVVVAAFGLRSSGESTTFHQSNYSPSADASTVRVATIRPKRNPGFFLAVEQLASVQPYFRADLRARVAGVVRSVKTDLGVVVKKGDLLVEIDVPDLTKEVLQKASLVEQRTQESRMARAKVKSAEAFVEVAQATLKQQEANVRQAEANADLRKKRLDRFGELFKRQAINQDLVDEQEKEWRASVGALDSAHALVAKARADVKEKETERETAAVDVDLKQAQVQVARHDLERSQALADYAKITAPFDGVVTARYVDPGDFVQNSTTGATLPLLSLSRIDLVTVVAKVPDNAAPLVTTKTPVEIRIDQLSGMTIEGTVTRYAPTIDVADRTMRVEVDVRNAKEYCRLDLREGTEQYCAAPPTSRQLLPGMNGYMRLKLNDQAGAWLVPSSAVFSRGGQQYVMLVEAGRVELTPAIVQLNDGALARIALVRQTKGGQASVVELTGQEEIVESRQAELDDGQFVRTNLKN